MFYFTALPRVSHIEIELAKVEVFLIILSFIDLKVKDLFILFRLPIHGILLLFNPYFGCLILFHESWLNIIIYLYNYVIFKFLRNRTFITTYNISLCVSIIIVSLHSYNPKVKIKHTFIYYYL